MEPQGAVPVMEILQHGIIHTYHIHQLESIAFLVGVNGIREGYLSLQLLLNGEIHQDLIFNAPGGIGGQTRTFFRVKTGDTLDESKGPDRDQILLICA